ncbi:MAG TPA: helix-turn-helix transcriptional regulator [Usitatibacter sp.]|jgi:transcriptional regulator with XRE-family HTH domain|nr:helix-turn-helix transcriptional regulator [Usitatibacter sp.]
MLAAMAQDQFRGIKSALARNVRALRLRRKMSQEELADSAGIDRPSVSLLERASLNPTLETLTKVALALQVRPGELLDGHFG